MRSYLIDFIHENGAPGEIRTPDRLVRSQVLYPTELRALITNKLTRTFDKILLSQYPY